METPYEIKRVDLRLGEHKSVPYLKINPAGKVPALAHGDLVLSESIAICKYLADQFPEKNFSPATNTTERANYYRWMAYAIGTLEPAVLEEARRRQTEKDGGKFIDSSLALTPIDVAVSVLEPVLKQNQFILGDRFTAADVMVGSAMIWANSMGLIDQLPHAKNWLDQLIKRKAYKKAKKD